ncbi:DEAD/DEAH box helicase [Cryobacterium frigoriphilum]|uniref:DEAD/DEAH box helicase n=1 Tax=Cryobacterium frigoriphilum TaxID=1259150 RepID=A0A4R8ZTJ1_9MICO|nr:DEAD/DEAH box helicase family protein [Cryobacterium frigoriphilum]TFD45000.1 DEAD/DEAH box helicase [Cryobacterium frigoriphilum]
MKFQLLDFQRSAAELLISEIKKAQVRYDNDPELLGAVVLEAATGAGKTVIATSVIEQLIFGSDATEPVEGTTILWVTNDPSLNAQTARKMQEASEKISDIRFIGQGVSFDEESFEPGAVYFLNTQAASVSARITKRSDTQTWTIWDTIANTVKKLASRFLVVVDEAHHGVTEKPGGSRTVVNKIVNGDKPIPVFIGISATADRLNKALEQQNRFKKNVVVPIDDVRESGLVKDRIVLAPAAKQSEVIADTTFVRLGVQKTLEFEKKWATYAEQQGEPAVKPALVVQLPDRKADDEDFRGLLRSVVDAVTEEWPGLITGHIVHTFAEHTAIDLGSGRAVRYMPPQDIQDATEVRVILAKNAITTGWDCPRAEVLVSLRASTDYTPIAQLIGRIVRQPLARRIASDETLNRVHAFLPRFDRNTVMDVVKQFAGGEAGASAEVVRITLDYQAPAEMQPALNVLAELPSYLVPAQASSPETRRLHALATLLDNDGIRPGAYGQATAYLNGKLDDEADKLTIGGELEEKRSAVSSASVYELLTSLDGLVVDGERSLVGTRLDAKNIDDVFKRAGRSLKDGTAEAYWSYLVDKEPDEDPIEAKVTVAALALTDQVVSNVERTAASLTTDWFKAHAKAISNLPEADRARYTRLQAESKGPTQRLGITIKGTIEDAVSVATSTELSDNELRQQIGSDLANRWVKHLYQDASDSKYWKKPFQTDGLERQVLETETNEPGFFAWYRNPTGGDRALCIPYVDSGTSRWAKLFPDFVFFYEVTGQIKASIIDPHGIQLEDWADKLRGYVDYADRHASEFRAIAPLTQIDDKMLFLAIHDASTREKVRGALKTGESVEAIFRAHAIEY